ncbi:MAG TPA: hypothetical protein VK576_03155 [Thermoleophilia bacterium]|nr:hypothetical protein [Thermoleophilia bacterium]
MDSRQVSEVVERLFRGRTDPYMDKHELMDRAHAMGMPRSLIGYLDALPPGGQTRERVELHIAEARTTAIGRDVEEALRRAA